MHRPSLPLFLVLAMGCTPPQDAADSGAAADTDATTDSGDADSGAADTVTAEVHELDSDTLAAWLAEDDVLLLNVHVPYAGEIPGTDAHIAYTDVDALAAEIGTDVDRVVVVYCKSGPMSAAAAAALVEREYRGIWDLPGGMNAWEAAGYTFD